MLTCIDFSHRAVFEYVHTPEMQLLLRKHTPDHFKDALFTSNLDVAFCKMVVMDPHDIVCPVSGWEQLSFCAQEIPYWGDHEIQSAKTRTPDFDFHKTTELAQILEEASLYHLRGFEKLLITTQKKSDARLAISCRNLSIRLAAFGLFTFADALLDATPQFLGSGWPPAHESHSCGLFQDCYYDAALNVGILRRILLTGVNPNLRTDPIGRTREHACWNLFLERLTASTHVVMPQEKELLEINGDRERRIIRDTSVIAKMKEVYAKPHTQDVIKTLIEFGAELTLKDVETLMTSLIKPEGSDFDWPEFLNLFSQPAKRVELEEERKERLRRWPESWLSKEDREMLLLAPELTEQRQSDRGAWLRVFR